MLPLGPGRDFRKVRAESQADTILKNKTFSAPELGHNPPSDRSVPFVLVSITVARLSMRSKRGLDRASPGTCK